MSKNQTKQKETINIVFPSDELGIEEEFLASKGSYVEDHLVKSSVFGEINIDRNRYRAKVQSLPSGASQPKRHDTVIAIVEKVNSSSLRINVYYINNDLVNPSYSAIMHISDASKEFIKNIDEYYAAGDIIRATIIDAKSIPIQLECKKSNTGAIYTNCINCGEYAKKIKKDLLQCISCGLKQSRKTAIDYGKVTLNTKF